MMFDENLFEKYDSLRENIAQLLLLREDIISIRDDMKSDDEYKVKLLYKKNIENLMENQSQIERDIINIFRAGEVLKNLEFMGTFVNLTQVFDTVKQENFITDKTLYKKSYDVYFDKNFENINTMSSDFVDETFKKIAKEISPSIPNEKDYGDADLWKKTLKAKSDNSKKNLVDILNSIESHNDMYSGNVDLLCENIAKIEENLAILDKEILEISKVCKENFDYDKLEEISKVIVKIEEKQKELTKSIDALKSIRKNLLDGFMGMLPNNSNNILN